MKRIFYLACIPMIFACGNKDIRPNKAAVVVVPKTIEQKNKEKIEVYKQCMNEVFLSYKTISGEIKQNLKIDEINYKSHFDIVNQMLNAYYFTDASITSAENATSNYEEWANSKISDEDLSNKIKSTLLTYKEGDQKKLQNWNMNVMPSVKSNIPRWMITLIMELDSPVKRAATTNIQIFEKAIIKINSIQ